MEYKVKFVTIKLKKLKNLEINVIDKIKLNNLSVKITIFCLFQIIYLTQILINK